MVRLGCVGLRAIHSAFCLWQLSNIASKCDFIQWKQHFCLISSIVSGQAKIIRILHFYRKHLYSPLDLSYFKGPVQNSQPDSQSWQVSELKKGTKIGELALNWYLILWSRWLKSIYKFTSLMSTEYTTYVSHCLPLLTVVTYLQLWMLFFDSWHWGLNLIPRLLIARLRGMILGQIYRAFIVKYHLQWLTTL